MRPTHGPDQLSERLHSVSLHHEHDEDEEDGPVGPLRPPPTRRFPKPATAARAPALLDRGGASKRAFVRPGGVAVAWAKCVGAGRTVLVRKRPPVGDAEHGAAQPVVAQPAGGQTLAEVAAFLRQRKRCARPTLSHSQRSQRPSARSRYVTEAAKLLAPPARDLEQGGCARIFRVRRDAEARHAS